MNQRAICLVITSFTAFWGLHPISAQTTTISFSDGAEGMVGPSGPGGATSIEPFGGNPNANMRTVFNDFGITFRNSTNPEFIDDYTQNSSITLSIDTKVEAINFGSPVSRPWLVELRDFDNPPVGYPWVSVWYKFADISASSHGNWTTFSVTIEDTSLTDLPTGWGGTGAEDPNTFEPILPADRTFASVLAGVDEIVFTTLEPGFFFGFTDHDVRIDNVSIARAGSAVPTTSTWGVVVMTLLVLAVGTVAPLRT
ncbi:MAG: PEP-CTERM sorting domain-containing protein [Phycisphaerae bacterium]